jgi:galactan endo-1,6-beta-galactosidase
MSTSIDLADLLFTTRVVTFNGRNLPGLGLNIARYNAGACTSQPIQGQPMQVSPNIPPHRQMQGFWLNWFNSTPTSTSWN